MTSKYKLVPVNFCEDTALSLAERTFSTEVDEQLAEDIIQYARRLHSRYTDLQPAPEVAKLVEALERLVFAAQCRDNSTGCQIHLIETRAELSDAVNNAEEALALYRQQESQP